jgi:uncharacterized phage protein gp47/JayE
LSLTASGFERKRLIDIVADVEDRLKLAFGNNIDLSPQSVFGQLVGIFSELISDEWQSQENVYNSQYPSTAQGNQLSNVVLYNGIVRQEATFSTVTAIISGVTGTTIQAGSLASVVGTGEIFVTDTEVTLTNGDVSVTMTAQNSGPIAAEIGTLTQIESPIFGWTGITNAVAASLGTDEETDAELRARRELSTQALGQNLVDALFGQLLNLDGVTDALVFSNGQNVTVNGIPPHQFLSVIEGGEEEDIVQTIWNNTPQGILSHGSISAFITDAQGFTQEVKYSRPTSIPIYFKIDITPDPLVTISEDEIKANVVAYGNENFGIGDDVIRTQFYTPINLTEGILSYDLFIGLAASPAGTTNISIDLEEVSAYDAGNVEVNIL